RRGPRHIVAVVLGGTSGAARDARMRGLIEEEIASASTQRTLAKIAESTDVAAAPTKAPVHAPRLARADTMAPAVANLVSEGDASPPPQPMTQAAVAPLPPALSP